MKNRSHGFTLMELMVTLAIAAAVISIGVPSYREFSRNSRMVSVANDILGGVLTARTEAIKRQIAGKGAISMCPSSDPEAAKPTCMSATARNFNGWLVFLDDDGDCDRSDTENILRIGTRIDLGNSPQQHVDSYSNGSCISFAPTGFLRTTARTTATRVVFCDERGNTQQGTLQVGDTKLSVARGLEITTTGRARITRDLAELTKWTDAKCP
jgi:type IV fimbrial biogenesis protein FimT